jgi:hypothetical protein
LRGRRYDSRAGLGLRYGVVGIRIRGNGHGGEGNCTAKRGSESGLF